MSNQPTIERLVTDAGAVELGPDETEVVIKLDVPASAVSLALALTNRMAYLGRMTEASVALKRTALVMQQLYVYTAQQLSELAQVCKPCMAIAALPLAAAQRC